jgi:hypothetical protein
LALCRQETGKQQGSQPRFFIRHLRAFILELEAAGLFYLTWSLVIDHTAQSWAQCKMKYKTRVLVKNRPATRGW